MMKLPVDQDEILRELASQSVKGGENIRTAVRDVTLKALQGRELTVARIKEVLRTVTEGVSLGAAKSKLDPEALLSGALAGMDDALLKAVEANRVALQQINDDGRSFEESRMKKALDELERYEDTLLGAVKAASAGATTQVRSQWTDLLKNSRIEGTDTGARVAATVAEYGAQFQSAMRDSRTAGLRAAHAMTRNYATLVSGVLIGLSEALQTKGAGGQPPAAAARSASPAAKRTAPKPSAKKTAAKKTAAKKTGRRAPKKPAAKKRR